VSIYCTKIVVWEKYLPPLLMLSSLAFPHRFHIAAATSFPSVMFSILTSSGLYTFTKTHKMHKHTWVLLLINLFKHVMYYTIPTQKTHYTGCPKMSTIWIQPYLLDSASPLFSNNCSPSKNFVFSIILLFVYYSYIYPLLIFPSYFSPLSPTSLSPTFLLPTPFFLTITYSTMGSYQCCLRKEPIMG